MNTILFIETTINYSSDENNNLLIIIINITLTAIIGIGASIATNYFTTRRRERNLNIIKGNYDLTKICNSRLVNKNYFSKGEENILPNPDFIKYLKKNNINYNEIINEINKPYTNGNNAKAVISNCLKKIHNLK